MAFNRKQWVANDHQVGNIKEVHDDGSLDIVLYARDGSVIGRESPAQGGPTGFEPCCDAKQWKQIKKPVFPLSKHAYIEEVVEYV